MITKRTNEIVVPRGCGLVVNVAVLLGSLFALQPGSAQDSGTVTVDVERCFELESSEARRACFGAQVDAALEERDEVDSANSSQYPLPVIQPGAAKPAQATTPKEASASEQALPVQTASETGTPRDAPSPEPETDEREYFGTIVEMRERLPNAYVIRLDNGQIWQQTEPKQYPLRPGLEVRLYPTRWGSRYRLAGVDSGGHIQVRRVR